MNPTELLSQRINLPQLNEIIAWASGSTCNLSRLWQLARCDHRRTSTNALWAMTHLPANDDKWLHSIRNELIDMLLAETNVSKKRMLLQLLRQQEYSEDELRTDLLDFCLSKINSECEPYAIRCFSLYTANKLCRHHQELIYELLQHIEMMKYQKLSPGLKSAVRQISAKIKRTTPKNSNFSTFA